MPASPPTPAQVLDDLATLSAETRADLRPTSLPLMVFGVLLVVASLLPSATWEFPWSAFWVIAAPGGFAYIAWRYRRVEAELGLGDRSRHYRVAAIGTAVLVFMVASVVIFLVSPLAGAGVALIAVSRATRDSWLTAAGVVLLLFGVLEPWFILSNRVYDVAQIVSDPDGSEAVFRYSRTIVTAVVGFGLLAAAVVARRQGR